MRQVVVDAGVTALGGTVSEFDNPWGTDMANSSSSQSQCIICGERQAAYPREDAQLCAACYNESERLFDREMSRIELIRTVRGRDVELYDIKHPDSKSEKNHCGQVILMKAGQGFEVKVCLRSRALDWGASLSDAETHFSSADSRLDALIGSVYLLMESWGAGPYFMDIFYFDKVVSTEGEL
jgi:hypothetical protein